VRTQVRNVALDVACTRDGRRRYVISAAACVTPQLLSGFITGRLTPTAEQRARIAAALSRPEVELFEMADT
jgi:hypothetical protein